MQVDFEILVFECFAIGLGEVVKHFSAFLIGDLGVGAFSDDFTFMAGFVKPRLSLASSTAETVLAENHIVTGRMRQEAQAKTGLRICRPAPRTRGIASEPVRGSMPKASRLPPMSKISIATPTTLVRKHR